MPGHPAYALLVLTLCFRGPSTRVVAAFPTHSFPMPSADETDSDRCGFLTAEMPFLGIQIENDGDKTGRLMSPFMPY